MYLSVSYIVFTILLYQCLTICASEENENDQNTIGCSIPIPDKDDYRSPSPIKETSGTTRHFRYGYLHFEQNEEFSLKCAGTQTIVIQKIAKKTNTILVKCLKELSFTYNGTPYNYNEVKCRGVVVKNDDAMNPMNPINPITTTEDPYAVAIARNNAGLQDCYILLPDPDYNFMPIPFITNTTPAIIHPNKYGFFTIKAEDEFKLTCADSEFVSPVTGVSEVTVKCITKTFLQFNDRQHQFDRFRCKNIPAPKLVITDQRCQTDDCKVTEVGFQTKSAFLVLYKLCFNPLTGHTEYAWYHAYTPMYKLRQVSIVKPNYIKTQSYGKINMETQYWNQDITLEKILKTEKNQNDVIVRAEKRYVVKTHLISKSEFYYVFEKHATYFYENTVPQWFTFSQGFWRESERVFRRHLSESESHHIIVSGSYLTSTLPDKNGVPHPFYLTLTKHIPVPQYIWKMNFDVKKNTGVVWIAFNNPTTNLNETKFLCTPIKCPAKIQRKNLHKKLMYCCSKETFEEVYGRLDPVVFGDFNTIPPHP